VDRVRLNLLASKLRRLVEEEGVATACHRALAHLGRPVVTDDFDVRHGTETSGVEALWNFDIASPNAHHGERYQATGEQELVAALEFLNEPLERFSFFDLGCGKGRTLLVASRLRFAEVVGVEFARELADIARRNVARIGARDASVIHADAADVVFPANDLVVFLYNPFSAEVLSRVLASLRLRAGGKLYVIYKAPRCASLLDESGFLEPFGSPPSAPQIRIWRAAATPPSTPGAAS
jgi:SAM-dependent methyltransferase